MHQHKNKHTHKHAHTHVHIHAHTHTRTYTHTHTRIHTHTHTHTHIQTLTHKYTHTQATIHVYISIYTYIRVRVHVRVCICVRMRVCTYMHFPRTGAHGDRQASVMWLRCARHDSFIRGITRLYLYTWQASCVSYCDKPHAYEAADERAWHGWYQWDMTHSHVTWQCKVSQELVMARWYISMTDEQEESTRRPTNECRGREGGGTRDRRGKRRAQDLNTLWLLRFVFICIGLVDGGGGWARKERGNQDGVATMSRPDKWSCLS